ncbi:MAG: hypothetical protein RQ757_01125 [Pseudomonadales bacterium]|nr:hypothetical protein [Pseudomonadales bacterium]
MKNLVSGIVLAAGLGVSGGLMAQTRYEYGTVIEAVPVYQTVRVTNPREDCWQEREPVRYDRRSGSYTPVLVSTIIGGALGNAVGNGRSNKRVGAVVGAILGHSIGRDIVSHNNANSGSRYRTVEHCEWVEEYYDTEELVGYQVRYRYNGEEYSVRTSEDPGDQIQLRVRVEPVR